MRGRDEGWGMEVSSFLVRASNDLGVTTLGTFISPRAYHLLVGCFYDEGRSLELSLFLSVFGPSSEVSGYERLTFLNTKSATREGY